MNCTFVPTSLVCIQHNDCGWRLHVCGHMGKLYSLKAGASKRKATQITADADSTDCSFYEILVAIRSLGETIEGDELGMGRSRDVAR
eukprot:2890334-Amphidinium_carterae.1